MAGMAVIEPKRNAAMFVTDVTVMLMPPLRSACLKRSCKAQTPLYLTNFHVWRTPNRHGAAGLACALTGARGC